MGRWGRFGGERREDISTQLVHIYISKLNVNALLPEVMEQKGKVYFFSWRHSGEILHK